MMPGGVFFSRGNNAWYDPSFYTLVLLLIAGRLFLSSYTGYVQDDAFITYRYARNLSQGDGFTYNKDEHVQGTSTPLYVLMLAGCASVFGSAALPQCSRALALLSDIASFAVLWRLLAGLKGGARFLACSLVALYPKVVLIGISGMEASFVVMLMLVSFYALFESDRPHISLVAFAALLLTRIDGVIWTSVALWFALRKGIRGVRLVALGSLAVLASWMIFSEAYFDNPIPYSIIAKSVSFFPFYPWFDPIRVLVGYFPFEGLRGYPDLVRVIAAVAFVIPAIMALVHCLRYRSNLVVFPLFFVVYNVVLSFERTVMTDWYYLPGYVSYAVCIGLLVDRWKAKVEILSGSSARGRAVRTAVLVSLCALLYVGAVRWRDNPAGLNRDQHIPLGNWLKDHANPNAHILLEPIGYIGWLSDLYVQDYIGLVTPQVIGIRRAHATSDGWFMDFVKMKQPEFIVLRNWEVPSNRLFLGFGDGMFKDVEEKKWFEEHYHLVWSPSSEKSNNDVLVLYQLRSS